MVIRWRTDRAAKGMIHYGLSLDNLTNQTDHAGQLTEHIVQLAKLKPNTRYWYSLWTETNRCLLAATNACSFVTPPIPGTVQRI